MSTLQVSTAQITTLSDGANATSCTNAIQGSAKAWVNFNGTTSPGTIRASYNVSSVTKNGTGDYTVNLTNSLVDANYSVVVGAGEGSAISARIPWGYGTVPTSNSYRFLTYAYSGGSNTDVTYLSVSFFR